MIDFGQVRQFIYFPKVHERTREPYVIHVLDKWGAMEWRGNRDLKDLLGRHFQFYPVRRCQPYSEALWERCVDWMKRRDALEDEFVQLMEKGVGDVSQV